MTPTNNETINISEIFYSLQGEGTRAGMPCVFVRLQGCMFRCSWCDTKYAQDANQIVKLMTDREILDKIASYNCNFIAFTGGEPLLQENIYSLLTECCNRGYIVVLETSGHLSLSQVDARVTKIMDFKCPSSEMSHLNNYENIQYLNQQDEIKFVIANRMDYEWTKEIISKYSLINKTKTILFSTVFDLLKPSELAAWILEDKLNVVLQLQLHKYIWEPNKRGV